MAKNTTKGMNRSAQIFLLLALVLSCLVGWGLYTFLHKQRSTIYLYAQDYPMGTKIENNMFLSTEIETALYTAAAQQGVYYATAEDINGFISRGDVLLADVLSFTAVTNNQVSASGGNAVENRLAKDMVAVALLPEKVKGLPDDLRIGSRVNVISGYQIDNVRETDLIFQNLLVVDVKKDEGGNLLSVYVEVDPADAVKLAHSEEFERPWVAVIKPGNYKPIQGDDTKFMRNYSSSMGGTPVTITPIGVDGAQEIQNGQQMQGGQGGAPLVQQSGQAPARQ